MAEFKLTERYKYAGDIYPHLTAIGFTPDEAVSFLNNITDADVVPKSEVVPLIALNRHLEAQNAKHDQALQDKARECNMAIDKIRLEHRAELSKAKSEVERLQIEIEALKIANAKMYEAFKTQPRDIFTEIEDLLRGWFDFFRQDGDIRESCAIMAALSQVSELKKKYTEN